MIQVLTIAAAVLIAGSLQAAPDRKPAFDRMDTDGNGSLSASELEAGMIKMARDQGERQGLDKSEVEARVNDAGKRATGRLKRQDKDGDGELSYEEWSAPQGNGKNMPPAEKKGNKKDKKD